MRRRVEPPPPPDPRDVALGLFVVGVRAAALAGRLAYASFRVAASAPVVGSRVRRAGEGLASAGQESRLSFRSRLEAAGGDVLAAPELERALDQALESPLTDAVGRSLAEHRVVDRVARPVLAAPDVESELVSALEDERAQRLVGQLTERVLRSPELKRGVEEIVASPEVRSALTRQTTSFADELAERARRRATLLDHRASRAPAGPYAGVATRGLALVIDAALVNAIVLVVAALVGLVGSLVGGLGSDWLLAVLLGAGWLLAGVAYFVPFWTLTGQTPGMRVMRLRVVHDADGPPSPGRSLVRLVGLWLAIVPLFAGFLPVLFDARRRGLHDFLAGTVVLYGEAAGARPAA
jgi:uncharacterized RDD family membrane protein YckC